MYMFTFDNFYYRVLSGAYVHACLKVHTLILCSWYHMTDFCVELLRRLGVGRGSVKRNRGLVIRPFFLSFLRGECVH